MKKLKLVGNWCPEKIVAFLKQVTPVKVGVFLITLSLLIIVCSQNGSEKFGELNVAGSSTLVFPLPPINEDWKTAISIVNLEDVNIYGVRSQRAVAQILLQIVLKLI